MEEQINQASTQAEGMNLSEYALSNLRTAGLWAKFLAIMGFIGVGFMVIAGFAMIIGMSAMSVYDNNPMGIGFAGIGFIYFITAILMFFPAYFMLMYANKISDAFRTRNAFSLDNASKQLKNYFLYTGVMTIIVLGLYFFAIIGFAVAGAALY